MDKRKGTKLHATNDRIKFIFWQSIMLRLYGLNGEFLDALLDNLSYSTNSLTRQMTELYGIMLYCRNNPSRMEEYIGKEDYYVPFSQIICDLNKSKIKIIG
jgi:hypothetical protein